MTSPVSEGRQDVARAMCRPMPALSQQVPGHTHAPISPSPLPSLCLGLPHL